MIRIRYNPNDMKTTKSSPRSSLIMAVVVVSGLGLLNGCAGMRSEYVAPAVILPPHIKSISVKHFQNQTPQTGIESKLWIAVTNEFIRDGRIAYVDSDERADAVVIGTVKQYRETELSHDVNLVPREYQLWIIMDLKLLDRENNQFLWEEPALQQKLQYFSETEPGGKTVEEAREELWGRFATDIVRRTVEGYGTVTSASPRAIPKSQEPHPENPPPRYPSTAPF